MPRKKSKVNRSKSERLYSSVRRQTLYFSRLVLPTEIINEVLSYLPAESLAVLVATSRETGVMVHNWLSTKQAVRNVVTELRSGVPSKYGREYQRDLSSKIAKFMLRVTLFLPIEERMTWIFRFVPRVRKVWKTNCCYPTDSIAILSAALKYLANFCPDEDVYIAVEEYLKKNPTLRHLIFSHIDECPVDHPQQDMRIRKMISQTFKQRRLLISLVKLVSQKLSPVQVSRLVYVIFGPCKNGRISWMPHVQSRKELKPLAEFLNFMWHDNVLKVADLIRNIIDFPGQWPSKHTAYLLSKLSAHLCVSLPLSSLRDKSDYSRLAELLVELGMIKEDTAFTIFKNLFEQISFADFKSLALKVFECTRKKSEEVKISVLAGCNLDFPKLQNIISFGNKVSEQCAEYYKQQGKDVSELPKFVNPLPNMPVYVDHNDCPYVVSQCTHPF